MAWESSTRRSRLPADWVKRRAIVLKRDGHQCCTVVDGQRCPAKATDVHHTNGADDHRIEVLVSLCHPHHDEVTKREASAARTTTRHPVEPHPGVRTPAR